MIGDRLIQIYKKLLEHYSNQHWWPAETRDEIVIGAVLTQNTAWKNVERAIENLKRANLDTLMAIHQTKSSRIKECIKPAGFYNQKTQYLKNVARFFVENGGFEQLKKLDTPALRKKLLGVKGVGKETADSILLYAFDRPIFVVDAYTKRLCQRHKLSEQLDYDSIQGLFMEHLDADPKLFNEYHALIVKNAKEHCRKKPICKGCPLEEDLCLSD